MLPLAGSWKVEVKELNMPVLPQTEIISAVTELVVSLFCYWLIFHSFTHSSNEMSTGWVLRIEPERGALSSRLPEVVCWGGDKQGWEWGMDLY